MSWLAQNFAPKDYIYIYPIISPHIFTNKMDIWVAYLNCRHTQMRGNYLPTGGLNERYAPRPDRVLLYWFSFVICVSRYKILQEDHRSNMIRTWSDHTFWSHSPWYLIGLLIVSPCLLSQPFCWTILTMWGPLVISWFITPSNYGYNYYKP